MAPVNIMEEKQLLLTLERLSFQLIENHLDFEDVAIIGLQRTGALLSRRLVDIIQRIRPEAKFQHGLLDVTFFRDDFGRRSLPLQAFRTELDFPIEGKKVILIDDVLYTGRTIRAAMDALLSLGRPSVVELLVLIDRRFSRQLPIEPSYVGSQVDSISSQHVDVRWTDEGFQGAYLFDKTDA